MTTNAHTTNHTTDHTTDHGCDVSLIEQLKSVPLVLRDWIKDERGLGLRNIPYGRYCQDAAAALQKAEAEAKMLKAQLKRSVEIAERGTKEMTHDRNRGLACEVCKLIDELNRIKATLNQTKK